MRVTILLCVLVAGAHALDSQKFMENGEPLEAVGAVKQVLSFSVTQTDLIRQKAAF